MIVTDSANPLLALIGCFYPGPVYFYCIVCWDQILKTPKVTQLLNLMFTEQIRVNLYRRSGVSSEESDLVPSRNEHPCRVEVGELCEVRPDVTWSPPQDGSVLALPVEDAPCQTVVHISPERRHHPSVASNWKSHRCKLRDLPQERHKTVVVNLRKGTNKATWIKHPTCQPEVALTCL